MSRCHIPEFLTYLWNFVPYCTSGGEKVIQLERERYEEPEEKGV